MDTISSVSAVLSVLALLCGVLFVLRSRGVASFRLRRTSFDQSRRVQVLERVALGPHHALYLVRIGGRDILIGTSPSSCHAVHEQMLNDQSSSKVL